MCFSIQILISVHHFFFNGWLLLTPEAPLPRPLQLGRFLWMVLLTLCLSFSVDSDPFITGSAQSLSFFFNLRRFQVLYLVLKTLKESGHEHVYNAAERPLLFAQTAAVLEVLAPKNKIDFYELWTHPFVCFLEKVCKFFWGIISSFCFVFGGVLVRHWITWCARFFMVW